MPTDGEGMEGRDTDGRLLRVSERKANKAEQTLQLQELLDSWRERGKFFSSKHTLVDPARGKVYLICAQELQDVLDG